MIIERACNVAARCTNPDSCCFVGALLTKAAALPTACSALLSEARVTLGNY
ncbi:hypothetical protein [Anaplasma phagocytophilum]|uniref:hypothetical protein n=1 Tax=Anaplasma phagocytophilum TaxID=948 RepID=UPI00201B12DF